MLLNCDGVRITKLHNLCAKSAVIAFGRSCLSLLILSPFALPAFAEICFDDPVGCGNMSQRVSGCAIEEITSVEQATATEKRFAKFLAGQQRRITKADLDNLRVNQLSGSGRPYLTNRVVSADHFLVPMEFWPVAGHHRWPDVTAYILETPNHRVVMFPELDNNPLGGGASPLPTGYFYIYARGPTSITTETLVSGFEGRWFPPDGQSLDLAISLVPFLGSADLLFNQGKVLQGTLGLAGDLSFLCGIGAVSTMRKVTCLTLTCAANAPRIASPIFCTGDRTWSGWGQAALASLEIVLEMRGIRVQEIRTAATYAKSRTASGCNTLAEAIGIRARKQRAVSLTENVCNVVENNTGPKICLSNDRVDHAHICPATPESECFDERLSEILYPGQPARSFGLSNPDWGFEEQLAQANALLSQQHFRLSQVSTETFTSKSAVYEKLSALPVGQKALITSHPHEATGHIWAFQRRSGPVYPADFSGGADWYPDCDAQYKIFKVDRN
ncbi:MAG: hypothetical protein HYR96_02585 [Deltaproteobacteria bacterium]|nr:hypothetical protein [Deltaproteobacteria bacterium]MBI3296259.1 hypothetical protein [Deltaproteobacteria bacterium]